jgi:hypothetical protein
MVVVDSTTRIAHLRGLRNKVTDCSDQEFGAWPKPLPNSWGTTIPPS